MYKYFCIIIFRKELQKAKVFTENALNNDEVSAFYMFIYFF